MAVQELDVRADPDSGDHPGKVTSTTRAMVAHSSWSHPDERRPVPGAGDCPMPPRLPGGVARQKLDQGRGHGSQCGQQVQADGEGVRKGTGAQAPVEHDADYGHPECAANLLRRGESAAKRVARRAAGYPGGAAGAAAPAGVVLPLRYRHGDQELSFFSISATVGAATDVTVEELTIEAFYPADAATAAALRSLA
jgi:hypothetical protein